MEKVKVTVENEDGSKNITFDISMTDDEGMETKVSLNPPLRPKEKTEAYSAVAMAIMDLLNG